jgi:hypothetical protein
LFSHITMNWRGRPLTSHEVVVNTIAATTTRTGLRVAAELDTASYPTGVKVSDDQLAQVPIIRHSWHGEWNYTVHPMPPQPADDNDDVPAPPRRSPSRHWLRDPALIGLTPTRWDQLIEKLRVARHAQREAHLHTRRKAVLTLDDRAAITVLYQRFSPPQTTLAHLFGVTPQTISNVIRQTRTLLRGPRAATFPSQDEPAQVRHDHHGKVVERGPLSVIGHTPEPTGTRLATPAELVSFAATAGVPVPKEIKSTCY